MFINVSYSSDRKNWSEPTMISITDKQATYTIDNIPAADCYLKIEGEWLMLDNFAGYELANLEHDLYIGEVTKPTVGMVNYPTQMKLSMANMLNKTELKDNYKAILLVDNKPVAEFTSVELAAYAKADLTLNYTPHAAGTLQIAVALEVDGIEVDRTDSYDWQVRVESTTDNTTIGAGATQKTSAAYVLDLARAYSKMEVLYTASKLGGVAASSEISTLSLLYNSTKTTAPISDITIWMENTDKRAIDIKKATFADVSGMTKVFEASKTFTPGGSDKAPIEMLFELTTPFTYTGNSIRVVIQAHTTVTEFAFNFTYNEGSAQSTRTTLSLIATGASESALNTAQYNETYSVDDSEDWFPVEEFKARTPVIIVGISKTIPLVTGSVTAADGLSAIADAAITVKRGDVIYSTMSDENGAYSLPILQANNQYSLEVSKSGYKTFTKEITVATSNMVENISLETKAGVGVEQLNSTTINGYMDRAHQYHIDMEQMPDMLSVFNSAGILIEQLSQNKSIDMSKYAKGQYMIVVSEGLHHTTLRVVR